MPSVLPAAGLSKGSGGGTDGRCSQGKRSCVANADHLDARYRSGWHGGALCGIGGGLCQTLQVKDLSPAHCWDGALHRNKHSGYRAISCPCPLVAAVPLRCPSGRDCAACDALLSVRGGLCVRAVALRLYRPFCRVCPETAGRRHSEGMVDHSPDDAGKKAADVFRCAAEGTPGWGQAPSTKKEMP